MIASNVTDPSRPLRFFRWTRWGSPSLYLCMRDCCFQFQVFGTHLLSCFVTQVT